MSGHEMQRPCPSCAGLGSGDWWDLCDACLAGWIAPAEVAPSLHPEPPVIGGGLTEDHMVTCPDCGGPGCVACDDLGEMWCSDVGCGVHR